MILRMVELIPRVGLCTASSTPALNDMLTTSLLDSKARYAAYGSRLMTAVRSSSRYAAYVSY